MPAISAERRYVQEDPAEYAGGDNLYAYVGGVVLEARDPSGLQSPYGLAGRDEGSWWDPHACGDCEPAGVGLAEQWDNFTWNDAATPYYSRRSTSDGRSTRHRRRDRHRRTTGADRDRSRARAPASPLSIPQITPTAAAARK